MDSARHDSPESLPIKKTRHDSPEPLSVKRIRHDSPEAQLVSKTQRDLSDASSPPRGRHDSPDLPPRSRQTGRLSPSPPANKQAGKDHKQHCRGECCKVYCKNRPFSHNGCHSCLSTKHWQWTQRVISSLSLKCPQNRGHTRGHS